MRPTAALLALAVLMTPLAARAGDAPAHKFIVPAITATTKRDRPAAKILTELVLDALLNRHGIRALGPSDIRSILSLDAQKKLLGCSDAACMAQLGGAVNADMVITGEVGRLGRVYVLTLKLLDARSARLLSRASVQMHHLSRAASAVGPLVDKLLGAPVHRAKALAILGPAKPAPKAMDPRRFCPKANRYLDRIANRRYSKTLVATRKALLEDLIRTDLKADFDEKRACLGNRLDRLEQKTGNGIVRAKVAADALDHRRRLAELLEMGRDLERVEEAWKMGLKEAENGAGQRPTTVPFDVGPGILSTPTHPAMVRRLKRAWPKAVALLTRALSAAKHGHLARFKALYDGTKDRTSPKYNYDGIRTDYRSGYHLDPCPLFIFAGQQIDRRAVELHQRGLLRMCVRQEDGAFVSTDDLYLKRVHGRWRIDHW